MSNITQVVNVDKNLRMLKKGVHASDRDQLLSSTGPFTFFAPSDTAFEKLEKGMMDDLLEPQNRKQLTHLINNHIVNGKIQFEDLKEGMVLETLNGKQLKVGVSNGNVTVGSFGVQQRPAKISNGVMHMIDAVLV